MKILSIETSCDETAIALVEVTIKESSITADQIESELFSQIDIHKEFGGVFPAVAKREHAKHLPILLEKILKFQETRQREDKDWIPASARMTTQKMDSYLHKNDIWKEIEALLEREVGLFETFKKLVTAHETPHIDTIAVTTGPGLEPALWVGINFARALSLYWNIPLVGTNHMKGHIFSVLLDQKEINFPALALLISGGHTELVELNSVTDFNIIGKTKDDAVGESYDKVARMLGIEYPGGPEIAKLAQEAREKNIGSGDIRLPRPMIHSKDLDFSFSGLKTAVLYTIRDLSEITPEIRMNIAHEFEQAVTDVILYKTKKALEQKGYKSLIVSGGVIANTYLRSQLKALEVTEGVEVLFPKFTDSTDNAQMIAVAGAIESTKTAPIINPELRAQGNLPY